MDLHTPPCCCATAPCHSGVVKCHGVAWADIVNTHNDQRTIVKHVLLFMPPPPPRPPFGHQVRGGGSRARGGPQTASAVFFLLGGLDKVSSRPRVCVVHHDACASLSPQTNLRVYLHAPSAETGNWQSSLWEGGRLVLARKSPPHQLNKPQIHPGKAPNTAPTLPMPWGQYAHPQDRFIPLQCHLLRDHLISMPLHNFTSHRHLFAIRTPNSCPFLQTSCRNSCWSCFAVPDLPKGVPGLTDPTKPQCSR